MKCGDLGFCSGDVMLIAFWKSSPSNFTTSSIYFTLSGRNRSHSKRSSLNQSSLIVIAICSALVQSDFISLVSLLIVQGQYADWEHASGSKAIIALLLNLVSVVTLFSRERDNPVRSRKRQSAKCMVSIKHPSLNATFKARDQTVLARIIRMF